MYQVTFTKEGFSSLLPSAADCGIVNKKGDNYMPKKNRSLPAPPTTAFGRRKAEEKEGDSLIADDIARAAAEGRLEEYLDKEMPDNDYARALASMMMGMTGMAGMTGVSSGMRPPDAGDATSEKEAVESVSPPPEDVVKAVHEGDVDGLKGLLQREHKRRSPEEQQAVGPEPQADKPVQTALEKDVLDRMMKIASENDVSVDWLVFRALKLYVAEYLKTGRL